METSIVEEVLTDGSKVYNLVFIDGSHRVVIGAIDQESAAALQDAFLEHAAHAGVYGR